MKKYRRFIITYTIILILAILGHIGRSFQFVLPVETQVWFFLFTVLLLSFLWEMLRLIHKSLNKVYPFERNVAIRITLQLVLSYIVVIIQRQIGFYVVLNYFLTENIIHIQHPFEAGENLFIRVVYVIDFIMTLAINLGYVSSYFFNRWKESLLKNQTLEKEKAMVQFDNLRNQLNPHLLFNALTSLNSLIYQNQELASQFLQHLSKMYRYILQNKDKDIVRITSELEFVDNFIFLLKTRYGKGIEFSIELSEEDRVKGIVPVTMQNLIENALKHNIVTEDKTLHISVYADTDYLYIRNTLQRKQLVESSNKQGLEKLKNLYRFLSEKEVEVLEDEKFFTVKVPLLEV